MTMIIDDHDTGIDLRWQLVDNGYLANLNVLNTKTEDKVKMPR